MKGKILFGFVLIILLAGGVLGVGCTVDWNCVGERTNLNCVEDELHFTFTPSYCHAPSCSLSSQSFSSVLECSGGCQSGECVGGASLICTTDSDCPSPRQTSYCVGEDLCSKGESHSCDNGECVRTEIILGDCGSCSYGCENGACRTSYPSECIDVDEENGRNQSYFVKGNSSWYSGRGTCGAIDSCKDETVLTEAICEEAYACPSHVDYSCPGGCSGGVCISGCIEDWTCGNWSSCTDGQKTRTCTDSNDCGTTENKPDVSKSCDTTSQQNQTNQSQQPNSPIARYYIQNKAVTIEKNRGGKNFIIFEKNSVETSLEIVEEFEKVYVKTSNGNKEIKISLDEAIANAKKIQDFDMAEIREEKGKVVYSILGTKKARLFFIFPVLAEVEQNIDVENGDIVSTKKPWWGIFALGI